MTVFLQSCAVGPDFKAPPPPVTDAYVPGTQIDQTESIDVAGGEAQHLHSGLDLPGQWWKLFGSTSLSALIDEAVTLYPEIDSQQAALREAQENLRAQAGVFYPSVDATGIGTREKVTGASIAPDFPGFITNVFQAGINVSYTFDLFGGERRAVQGAQAQVLRQRFMLEGSLLTLTANVASTVIQIAALNDLIEAAKEIAALEGRQLSIVKRQFDLGSRTRADVLQQQAAEATTRATLFSLTQQLATTEHQLAVLTGRFPHDLTLARFGLSNLTLPQDLPVSLPSSLVTQRPDIKAQEMVMRDASAQIGVATANMLPQLTLGGSYGGESFRSSNLFSAAANSWSLAGGIAQPLFEGGALRAKRRAAIDAYDQAYAQYRLIVLQAFQSVADTLAALDNDAHVLKAESDAVSAASASLELIQKQFDSGTVDSVTLLNSQQAYQQARLSFIRALANRYTDSVMLFQALGGGWWNRDGNAKLQSVASETRFSLQYR